jgi:hypothetical protein
MELDTRTLVDSILPNPFQQGNVVGIQLGNGAGVSGTGEYNASTAIQVAANPKPFKTGINFLSTSLAASGSLSIAPAIAMAALPFASGTQGIEWFSASGTVAAAIYKEETFHNLVIDVPTGSNIIFAVNGSAIGVSCGPYTPSGGTMVVTYGIVTHC